MAFHRFAVRLPASLLVLLASVAPAPADEPQGTEFFEARIRPVLVKHCYTCHSSEAGKSEGNLLLDSRQTSRRGGDRGPAIVPGDPQASLLFRAIAQSDPDDPDFRMPPKGDKLPAAIVADFRRWIEMGAPDPRIVDPAKVRPRPPTDLKSGRQFWSFQKPALPAVPQVSDADWPRNDIDRFILAKLDAADLQPSPDAEPAAFLRRLYFDLIGLPPAPADLDRFLSRISAADWESALEQEVDALLASDQYGERWGRHWLDVARFAESSGKEANISFPYAWRYRDYVIDCFNADTPFDRFIVEQIAGDLLPYDSPQDRARLLIATGFLAVGPKNLDEGNQIQFLADLIDEQIDAVSRAILANSIACARCHDHKFDPFHMQDYYALAGIFASTNTYFGTFVTPSNRVGGDPLPLPREAEAPILHEGIPAERVAQLKAELAALKKEQIDGQAAAVAAYKRGEDPSKYFSLRDALRIFWTSGRIEGQLEKVDDQGRPLPLALGVLDRKVILDVPLLERGEIGKPKEKTPRGFPRVIPIEELSPPADQSGRLQLARWLTHPDQPLTARVMANRIWQHVFGAGLVRTVDNFGATGERPTHPELLDHLAVRFTAENWSIKKLVKELVLSRTYRQASTFRKDAFSQDPENRLLWRIDKRRLDAEAIRDAMLAVSGELDRSRPLGSLVGREIGDRPISLIGLDPKLPADLDGARTRSVYLPVLRDRLPDVLDLFDFAEPSLVTGQRETTNVPLQALYLMNSEFVQARAAGLAKRLQQASSDRNQQVELAFRLCFSRLPDAHEKQLAARFFADANPVAANDDQAQNELSLLTSYCQALLATAEFRNID